MVGQKLRLTENFCAYDFMGPNSTSEAQEYGSMVFQVEQDHLGMLNSSVVGDFDEFDMLDQFDYVGHLVVSFDRPGQQFKRQECLRRPSRKPTSPSPAAAAAAPPAALSLSAAGSSRSSQQWA